MHLNIYHEWERMREEVATVFFKALSWKDQEKPRKSFTRITYWPVEIRTFQIQIMSVKKQDNLKIYIHKPCAL
jgi:hypothetical protein